MVPGRSQTEVASKSSPLWDRPETVFAAADLPRPVPSNRAPQCLEQCSEVMKVNSTNEDYPKLWPGEERPREIQLFLTELDCSKERVWEKRLKEWKVPE